MENVDCTVGLYVRLEAKTGRDEQATRIERFDILAAEVPAMALQQQ